MALVRSSFSWLRLWDDHFEGTQDGEQPLTREEKRWYVLHSLKRSGFGWQILFVGGFGFLTDAYDIFSINTILPMISVVYWEDEIPSSYLLGLNLATLLGSMLGQIVLGYLADRYGRRKVYGLELTFTIMASLGLAISGTGVFNSMSLIGLLIWWRLVMGIGVGSDYPLSAVLTAEYAPAEHRDKMLAALFFFQPFGQLVAVLVAFAATAGFRSHIASIATSIGPHSCSVFASDVNAMECARTLDKAWRLVAGLGAVPAAIAVYFRFTIPESVYYTLDVIDDSDKAFRDKRYFDEREASDALPPEEDFMAPSLATQLQNEVLPNIAQGAGQQPQPQPQPQAAVEPVALPPMPNMDDDFVVWFRLFRQYLRRGGNGIDLFATSMNWMLLDFTFYLLGVNSSTFVPTLFGENNGPDRPPYSLIIDEERHIMESSSVGLLLGSIAAVTIMYLRGSNPFARYFNTEPFIKHIGSPRELQMWGFAILAPLFIIVGALYITLPRTHADVAIVIFYQLCNVFFNLGPNTTTFMIPAQIFPTHFRCTCYGISAAIGKLGSVFGQIVVTKVTGNKGLGGTMVGFALVMLAGAVLSKFTTPETCDSRGKSLELSELGERAPREEVLRQRENDYRNEHVMGAQQMAQIPGDQQPIAV